MHPFTCVGKVRFDTVLTESPGFSLSVLALALYANHFGGERDCEPTVLSIFADNVRVTRAYAGKKIFWCRTQSGFRVYATT